MATDASRAKMPFRTDDDVRAYVRKRKRSNKNCSVSHLRRALNIGYKKAKRIHDEVEEELRSGKLVLDNEDYDQDSPDEEEVAPRPTRAARRRTASAAAAAAAAAEADAEEEDGSGITDDIIRDHIRKKLRKGEIIYVNKMRALGITYRRARRIIQEFVDQGKIQKLPKNYTINGGGGAATPGTPRTRRAVAEARARQEAGRGASPTSSPSITGSPREEGEGMKRVPPKQKAKEDNKKAVENSRSPSGEEEGGEGEASGERLIVGSGAGQLNGGEGDARRNLGLVGPASAVGMELSSAIGMQFGAGSLLPADVGSIPATLTIANIPMGDVPEMLVATSGEAAGAPDLALIPDDIPATLGLAPERPAEQTAEAAGEAVQQATEEVVSGGEDQLIQLPQEDPTEILAALLPEGGVDAVAMSEDAVEADEAAAHAEAMMQSYEGGEHTEAAHVEHHDAHEESSSADQPVATQEDVAIALQGEEPAKTS